MKNNPWKTLSRRTILDHSKYLSVEVHTVELPDGRIIPDWSWVVTPDYVVVLPVTRDQKFLCFRQTKYGLEGLSLAPVGGLMEPGEVPLDAAKRELLEEMGYEAEDWVDLGHYRMDPNRGVAVGHLFMARDVDYVTEPDSDDLEEQQLIVLDQDELEAALTAGEFKVLAWTTTVALALQYLNSESKDL